MTYNGQTVSVLGTIKARVHYVSLGLWYALSGSKPEFTRAQWLEFSRLSCHMLSVKPRP